MTPTDQNSHPARELSDAKNVLIRASAGTGKTYQLAQRYIRLLGESQPDRILATTFTRKAAGEILERILLELANDERESSCGGQTAEGKFYLLKEFTRRLHRIHIGTLDSFFINVGSAISLELGLPAGWRIVEEHELSQLRLRAIESLLQEESTTDVMRLMHMLSKGESRQRVTTQLLDAVERFHELYLTTDPEAWHRLQPSACLSAGELNDALLAFTQAVIPDHKKWESAHDTAGERAARNDWEAFIESGIARALLDGHDTFDRKRIPDDVAAIYRRLIHHARAIITRQLAERNEATWQLLQRYDEKWNEIAREERAQSFLHVTLRLADHFAVRDESPGGEERDSSEQLRRIAFRIDSQVDHLLLDEFQDTSISQWNALSRLAEQVAGSDAGGFFCVGDEKQAIYGWRGGRSELFTHLHQRLNGIELQSLNQSRRSSQPVIDVVNEVFQNAIRHPDLKDSEPEAVADFIREFPLHTTVKEFPGYAELTAAETVDDERADVAVTAKVVDLVQHIQQRAPGWSVGILMRTNGRVGKLVYALRQAGIDASEEGGTPITDSAAVQVVLSALTLADHPGDTVARFHVARSPLGTALGMTDFQDDDAACRAAGAIRAGIVDHGYSRTLSVWALSLSESCDARETDRLRQLVELADEYQPIATLRTADFIRFVESRKVESPTRSPIRVMTIHQAKGLQFDVVILAELDTMLSGKQTPEFVTGVPDPFLKADGMCLYVNAAIQSLLPDDVRQMFRSTAYRTVREALCLLYVAMTRAVRALYMVCPPPPVKADHAVPRTYAGLLSVAMQGRSLLPGEVISRGDGNWFNTLPAEGRAERHPSVDPSTHPVRFASAVGAVPRARGRLSPSRELLEGRVRLSQVLSPTRRAALDRGSLIHAWFESILWLDDARPTRGSLQKIADELGAGDVDIPACLQQFQAMLSRPEIAFALSRASYLNPASLPLGPGVQFELAAGPLRLEVERERRFVTRDGNKVVSGSIDRLVLVYSDDRLLAADILDFKTDAATIEQAESLSRREHYRGQLACYARAVAGIYQIAEHRISTRLVMLSSGRVEAVDWRRESITAADLFEST